MDLSLICIALASNLYPMESLVQAPLTILSSLFAFFLFVYFCHQFWKTNYSTNTNKQVPRAAGALPIIGHLHLFGSKQLVHKTLGDMAYKYGPAFIIRIGAQENLVVSSWEVAKECFTTLDKVFSERPKITATKLLGYNYAMFGLASSGPYWRQVRKIVTLELLSHSRIDMLKHTRASEVQASLRELYDLWSVKQTALLVDMKQCFGNLTLNASVRMVGGKRFVGGDSEARSHQKLMRDFIYFFGVFVLSDAIPLLGWFDLQGHEKTMKRIARELDTLLQEWLEEHKERRRQISTKERADQDFMDVMLTNLDGADFSAFDADTINKATCLNLILAGSDTVMITLTWALSLLLNNPLELKKAQEEVDTYVSKDRHVEESDIENLVYLQAVVKETLRLYPPVPIISLHSAMQDCTISPGYRVRSGTRLMVNTSKIHRDGNLWPEPDKFRPERFMTRHNETDVSGQHFEFIPFGSGRRSCPGNFLALQMVNLTLAGLLHCYEFSGPDDEEIDMTESPGFTNLKATPLEVLLTPRVRPEVFGT